MKGHLQMLLVRIFFFLLLLLPLNGFGQLSRHTLFLKASLETQVLDSLSIYSPSLQFFEDSACTKELQVQATDYSFLLATNEFRWIRIPQTTCYVRYETWPIAIHQWVQRYPLQVLYSDPLTAERSHFQLNETKDQDALFGGSGLQKNGSISRGLSFGNAQNLGIQSTLNLQLNGRIAPNLELSASLSDANVPLQADGTTSKLQEFDQVFIQVHNQQLQVSAGDFWIYKPMGTYMSYRKRAQGLSAAYKWQDSLKRAFSVQNSVGLSKGKFNRQVIQGVEANQGPYRLIGAENEPYIVLLSGTERIYIDGKLLTRGQEFDYIIDYATGELRFTSRNLITKDSRIVAEFQYADQNYARSLLQHSSTFSGAKTDVWLNAYREQDLKNQALQQVLTDTQKLQLSQVGDQLALAQVSGADSVGFLENANMYRMCDSLGFTSIYVFSVDPQVAHYRCQFTQVGPLKGDYQLAGVSASGNYYKWVAPINGIPQGDYAPIRRIITPKSKQLITAGVRYKANANWSIESEAGLSQQDLNLYSSLQDQNNTGFAAKMGLSHQHQTTKDSSQRVWQQRLNAQVIHPQFSPIEQFRAVEFDRDWNIRNQNFVGLQKELSLSNNFIDTKKGKLNLEAQYYQIDSLFRGQRLFSDGTWKDKGFQAKWDASLLQSKSAQGNNIYLRHRLEAQQNIWIFQLSFKDDHERNVFNQNALLASRSYQFYDAQLSVGLRETKKINPRIYYRERSDQRSDSTRLQLAAKAITSGLELNWKHEQKQQLQVILGSRQLRILDSSLIHQEAENSLVGRIDYNGNFWKRSLSISTFYELGSGLEQKKQFQYIRVNDGQGMYAWIDYNLDGIKDLNEFEIAQYVDQAQYVRVFVPSNQYARVYSNEYNQSVYWRPELLWQDPSGMRRTLARFSNQTRIRIQRKVQASDLSIWANPFASSIADTSLLSSTSTLSNTLFFNRNSRVFNAEFFVQQNETKTLLANGQDAKRNSKQQVTLRYHFLDNLSIECAFWKGTKASMADYTSGRNYDVQLRSVEPQLIFQQQSQVRLTLQGRLVQKTNLPIYGSESCLLREVASTWKWNKSESSSLTGELKWVQLNYTGNSMSAVAYELLEGLRPGTNLTWQLSFQKSLGKNLQLTLNYAGRHLADQRFIHTGSMEVRAYF
ncbi:MAG: hypothetical protein RLZZ301_905 [Bacteroidota bacterium]|jgi:hypothetical protein